MSLLLFFFSPPAFSGIPHTGSHLTAPLCQAALNLGLFGPMSPPTIRSPQDPGTYLRSSSHRRSPSQWKLQSCNYNLVSVFSRFLWPFSRLILKLRRQHILLWASHCRNDKYVLASGWIDLIGLWLVLPSLWLLFLKKRKRGKGLCELEEKQLKWKDRGN